MSHRRFFENDEALRKRAMKVKQILSDFHKHFANVCVVSHWYLLTTLTAKRFSEQSASLEYPNFDNCQPYFCTLQELQKVQ